MQTMLKHLLLLLLALPPLAGAAGLTLSPEGYGAVRFGMPIATAEKAVGQHTREPRKDDACQYVEFDKYPGIYFMLEDGVVVRADTSKNLSNSAGASINMDIEAFMAGRAHENLEVRDIDGLSKLYLLKTPDKKAALVLYTVYGKVRGMWAGTDPAYTYYEGCM